MDKTRAMPVLATAAMALSLAACQGMGGQGMGGREESGGAAPQSSSVSSAAAQQAASPDLVRDIQRNLAARGYNAGPPDGVYGNSTEQALRRFQSDQRLTASGQIDTQTLAALGVTGEAGQRAATERPYTPTKRRQGAMAPLAPSWQSASMESSPLSSSQVRGVQQNLTGRGYDPGQVDGLWGPRTQQALRDFQRDQNMSGSGHPDAQTLAALGVESGSPETQTGQLPGERRREDIPDTGSQAPGSSPESERRPGLDDPEMAPSVTR